MLAGVLPRLRKMGTTMKYFGHPTSTRYEVWKVDASGNFVSSIKAKLWEDEESLIKISMGMVTPV